MAFKLWTNYVLKEAQGSWVYVPVPSPLASLIRAQANRIDTRDLTGSGREQEPHVTLMYGLNTSDVSELLGTVDADAGEVKITGISIFDNPNVKVLKLDVDGKVLFKARKGIEELQADDNSHKHFNPHITLAYLKPDVDVKRYLQDTSLIGKTFKFDRMGFRGKNGLRAEIPLQKAAANELSEFLSGKTNAIKATPQQGLQLAYGSKWRDHWQNALKYRQAHPEINYLQNLSAGTLTRSIPVEREKLTHQNKMDVGGPAAGITTYTREPDGGIKAAQIKIPPNTYDEDYQRKADPEILKHELRHATQTKSTPQTVTQGTMYSFERPDEKEAYAGTLVEQLRNEGFPVNEANIKAKLNFIEGKGVVPFELTEKNFGYINGYIALQEWLAKQPLRVQQLYIKDIARMGPGLVKQEQQRRLPAFRMGYAAQG